MRRMQHTLSSSTHQPWLSTCRSARRKCFIEDWKFLFCSGVRTRLRYFLRTQLPTMCNSHLLGRQIEISSNQFRTIDRICEFTTPHCSRPGSVSALARHTHMRRVPSSTPGCGRSTLPRGLRNLGSGLTTTTSPLASAPLQEATGSGH